MYIWKISDSGNLNIEPEQDHDRTNHARQQMETATHTKTQQTTQRPQQNTEARKQHKQSTDGATRYINTKQTQDPHSQKNENT